MFQVIQIKGQMRQVFGVYPTVEMAEKVAKTHREAGYWDSVVVEAV